MEQEIGREKFTLLFGEKLQFLGVNGYDVYNISAPFRIGNRIVIAARVELRKAWADSHTIFLEEDKGKWIPVKDAPVLQVEDGFATQIGDKTIFGGVEIYSRLHFPDVNYRTVFYQGHNLSSLEKFVTGPDMMKDIRLVSLTNDRIGVFTRPQGGNNGRGRIGYIELQNLEDLNIQNIQRARIIENQFAPEEWGGANELHPLQDGRIGIIGHIAHQDTQKNLHYYAMSFVYDPRTHQTSPIKIIATRENFPIGEAKAPRFTDVVFPGGLVRHGNGTATLYTGLSDAEAGSIILANPFYE